MLVIDFRRNNKIEAQFEIFKKGFETIPGVISAAASYNIPGGGKSSNLSTIENSAGEMEKIKADQLIVDESFLPQYEIKVMAGRNFSRDFPNDKHNAIIINEQAAKKLGYNPVSAAIGKRFSDRWDGRIIDVVADFHFHSLQEEVSPLVFQFVPDNFRYFTLSVSNKNLPVTIEAIETKWRQLSPDRPLNYFFLDEAFDKQYRAEANFGKLFSYFTALAIFISCTGLFGLALFHTVQRTKEIGIRKVLGATVPGIIGLLSKDFLKLVLVAFIIASPAAWWSVNKWLQNFAYRINISWWIFLIAGIFAIFIAFATVSFQAIKLALTNPAKSLRTE